MSIIFRCNNRECRLYPCFVKCNRAFNGSDFGDESVTTPDTCPFVETSDEYPDFQFVKHDCAPDFGALTELEDWYSLAWDALPEELRDAVDNCEFHGEMAQTDYRTVVRFANLMRYAAEADRWNLSREVDDICGKFKKREILMSALETGYRMGLMRAARIMSENKETNNDSI